MGCTFTEGRCERKTLIRVQTRHMKQAIRSTTDPTEREIDVSTPPWSIHWLQRMFPLCDQLQEVAAKIQKLVATEPGRAVRLYETFLAAATRRRMSSMVRIAVRAIRP